MKARKKIVTVDAVQWFRHGDHPDVTHIPLEECAPPAKQKKLGWLPTPEGGHLVYPGDWIIVDSKGRRSTCNPNSFKQQYEPAEVMVLPGGFLGECQ